MTFGLLGLLEPIEDSLSALFDGAITLEQSPPQIFYRLTYLNFGAGFKQSLTNLVFVVFEVVDVTFFTVVTQPSDFVTLQNQLWRPVFPDGIFTVLAINTSMFF